MSNERLPLEKIAEIIVDQLNPTAARDLIIQTSQLIDDPKSVIDELLESSFATNKFAGKENYIGIVLAKLSVSEGSLLSYVNSFLPYNVLGMRSNNAESPVFICMIPALHAAIGNPFINLVSPSSNDGAYEYIKRCFRFPFFEIDAQGDQEEIDKLSAAEIGSLVNVHMVDETFGKVTKLLTKADMSKYVFDKDALAASAAASSVHAAGNQIVSGDAVGFYNELRAAPAFQDFSDTMLMALVANAKSESNFVPDAAGDIRSSSETRAIEAFNGQNGARGNYCSFGYWQLNVCPEVAEGREFVEYFDLDLNDKKEVYNALIDKDKQFEFIAWRLQSQQVFQPHIEQEEKTGMSGDETAAFYAGLIAQYFENCSLCQPGQRENVIRQEFAASLYRELRSESEEE